MRRGKSTALLVIPDDFRRDRERSQARVQLLLDGAGPLTAARIGGYVAQVAATFDGGGRTAVRDPDAPPKGTPPGIDVRQRFWFNRTLHDSEFFLTSLSG